MKIGDQIDPLRGITVAGGIPPNRLSQASSISQLANLPVAPFNNKTAERSPSTSFATDRRPEGLFEETTGYPSTAMEHASFAIGEPVVDRDQDDDPNTAIIVNCPPKTADKWTAYRDTTVAEDNPDYPEDAPVAVVVYRNELTDFDPDWDDRDTPYSLSDLNEAGISHYSFPAPRLKSIERSETDDEQEAQSDERTPEESSLDDEDEGIASTDEEPAIDDDSESDSQTESKPEPSAALMTLKETLAERGVSAEINTDGETVTAEKLGVTYHVKPEGVIDGDGPHREQIERIAAEI